MQPQWTVLVTDRAWPDLDVERAVLEPAGAVLVEPRAASLEAMVELAPQADAILNCWWKMPAELLDAAPRCRIVSRYGIGLDSIPLERASELGILVTNVPDFCLDEVSDHAMALLLAAARGVAGFSTATAIGSWTPSKGGSLPRLRGKTLGIVGFGNIGRRLAPKAQAFGMDVVAYGPRLSGNSDDGIRIAADLSELLQESDFVSLNCPSTPETRGMMGAAQFAQMKPTAWLINTSRGAVIDEEALLHALDAGQIAGAALDVLTVEPPPVHHPLLSHTHTIVTPHVAFASAEAVIELRRRAAEHVASVFRGELPPHVVNPGVLAKSGRHGISRLP